MERFMETLKLNDIDLVVNRVSGGMGNIMLLAESIKRQGMIEPPVVRAVEGGKYRVIAGRRRLQAAALLGLKSVDCVVREGDDVPDEEVALAENVNREAMHPLDEAVLFRSLMQSGESCESVAKRFERKAAEIFKRLQLLSLTDGMKAAFREGLFTLSAAAFIAELSKEEQDKFEKKARKRAAKDGDRVVPETELDVQIWLRNRCLRRVSLVECAACLSCDMRSHYADNPLFEVNTKDLDVCFDARCYADKVKELVVARAAECMAEHGQVDRGIVLEPGVEKLWKPIAGEMLVVGDKALRCGGENGWKYTMSTERKKNTMLNVYFGWEANKGACIKVKRMAAERYQEAAPAAGVAGTEIKKNAGEELVKEYHLDILGAVGECDILATARLLDTRYKTGYFFIKAVEERLFEDTRHLREQFSRDCEYDQVLIDLLRFDFSIDLGDGYRVDALKAMTVDIEGSGARYAERVEGGRRLCHWILLNLMSEEDAPSVRKLGDEFNAWEMAYQLMCGYTKAEFKAAYLAAMRAVIQDVVDCKDEVEDSDGGEE